MIIKLIINLSGFSGFFTRANHRGFSSFVARFNRDFDAYPPMQTREDMLRFAIAFALIKARKVVRGLRQGLTEDERYVVADAVVWRLKEHGDPPGCKRIDANEHSRVKNKPLNGPRCAST